MKFDVVIGNPPYNDGADIDFIFLGNKLIKNTGSEVLITPAKEFVADPNQIIQSYYTYGNFQEKIVPCIDSLVFYPCCRDIFDILQVDGIAYYHINAFKVEKCKVVNRSKYLTELNSTEIRDIKNRKSLINIGNELVKLLGNYESFKVEQDIQNNKKYYVWINTKNAGGALATLESRKKTMFIGATKIYAEGHIPGTAEKCIMSTNNLMECKSLISYISSRFVQFFRFINQSKLTNTVTDDGCRFVPAPDIKEDGSYDWSHIYTDEYLYKEYNIPQKYIDIIESIIKERDISEVLNKNEI